MGVQVAYFPIWFDARGLDGREIATLLAAAPAARILSNLLGTHLADRRGDYGRLIVILQAVVTLIFAGMDVAQGFVALFAAHTLLCFVQGPIGPIFDGLALEEARQRREAGLPPVRLARVRAFASLSMLLFMVGSGPVASAFSKDALIRIMASISVFSLISAGLLLRDVSIATPKAPVVEAALAPLRRPDLIASVILCSALLTASHGVMTAFGSLHWVQKGLGDDFVALAWGLAVVADMLFFFAVARWFGGRKYARTLIILGAAGAVCRWLLMATDPEPVLILLAQCLGALPTGALSLGFAYLLAELGGRAYTTRVHGWLAAANGVTLSASLYVSGWLNDAFGQQAYLVMAAMAGGALVASLALAVATRHGLPLDDEKAPAAEAARAVEEEVAM